MNKPKMWTGDREWWRQTQERDSRPCHDMKVTISPDKVKVGQSGTWVLTCEVKRDSVTQEAHIGILCPADWVGDHGCPAYPLISIGDSSAKIGYAALVTASSSNSKVRLEIGVSRDIFYAIIDIVVLEADLIQGDVIKIVLGDPKSCFLRAQRRAQKAFFEVAVDSKGDGKYDRVGKCPSVEVVGDFPSSLILTAQPVQLCGQPFELKVAAIDSYGNVSESYCGKVEFQSADPKANLPEISTFSSKDKGRKIFNISLNTSGTHTILALDRNSAIIGRSNPIYLEDLKNKRRYKGYQVYFGDIHVHTMLSDGYGTPDEAYIWAKEVKNLDFCAISDHSEGGFRCSTDKLWEKICKSADQYYEPDKFVTFKGFEWSSWNRFGDKCVYYRKDGQCYPYNDPLSNTPDKLWELLKAGETITIPHHTKLGGLTNWDYH
ncbi:DUF3604 domain-containing protein, partial [bacterium]|nr:DUF3604 domain-containing protein [bacterium]